MVSMAKQQCKLAENVPSTLFYFWMAMRFASVCSKDRDNDQPTTGVFIRLGVYKSIAESAFLTALTKCLAETRERDCFQY